MTLVLGALGILVGAGVVVNTLGLWLRARGQAPLDPAAVTALGQSLATTAAGRHVAYLVYGRLDPEAPVVINLHGSGLEAGFEATVYADACAALGCRGIAISLPGCGHTDQKPGRRVWDWPREDLAAVLEAERVDRFFLTGHSQGTAHALAAALAYPERCVGLGLQAPFLPPSMVEELGLDATVGAGGTPRSGTLERPWMGWYFAAMGVVLGVVPPSLLVGYLKRGLPRVAADADLLDRVSRSLKRSVVRGTVGGVWETAQDTCFSWGFDLRALQHDNAVVWHADDDTAIPASQGRWLADHLGAERRHAAEGYGHFTHCVGAYRTAEGSLVAALLQGARAAGADPREDPA